MKPFTPRERAALHALCDTLVPRVDGEPAELMRRSATDVGVPDAFEETLLRELRPGDGRQLRLVLQALDTPAGSFLVGGSRRAFTRLSPPEREAFLLRLARSPLPAHRSAFQAFKRLILFMHYAIPAPDGGPNPNWANIGYPAPDLPARAPDTGGALPLAEVPATGEVWYDAVVVGSGAGGGVAAALLAQAGRRVLVVEAGPLRRTHEFDGREAEGNRDLYEGAGAFTSRDGSVSILAGRTAGGGTTVNWLTSLAPPASLRAEWEALGLDDLTGKAFDEHVRLVSERVHVTTGESAVNGANGVLRDGARALGYVEGRDWRLLPRNADGCRNRCDPCEFGCPFGAKRGTLVTYLADAAQAGARFLFDARAERVLVDGGRATGVDVRLGDGRAVRVHAPVVVAAGGAVQTAALLLRSGLRHKALGRLFIHPATSVAARFPKPVDMWRGPAQTILIDRFRDLDGRGHGALLEAVPAHPGLTASSLPWTGGAAAKEVMRDYARTAGLLVLTRDRDPGRVTTDRDGRPVVDYRVSRHDARHMVRGMQELARVEAAAGADRIMTLHARPVGAEAGPDGRIGDPQLADLFDAIEREGVRPNAMGLFTAHQLGTAPLGRDGEGFANPQTAEAWDVEGLYVADGSAFPTSSGVNPMLTILSLTHRNMSRLAHRLKAGR